MSLKFIETSDGFTGLDDLIPRVPRNNIETGAPVLIVGRTKENAARSSSSQFEARVFDAIARIKRKEHYLTVIERHGRIVYRQAMADLEKRSRL
jgi:hypothetical protein